MTHTQAGTIIDDPSSGHICVKIYLLPESSLAGPWGQRPCQHLRVQFPVLNSCISSKLCPNTTLWQKYTFEPLLCSWLQSHKCLMHILRHGLSAHTCTLRTDWKAPEFQCYHILNINVMLTHKITDNTMQQKYSTPIQSPNWGTTCLKLAMMHVGFKMPTVMLNTTFIIGVNRSIWSRLHGRRGNQWFI